MRQNVPVTQREFPLAECDTLLSTTDLKGRIVYANDAFIKVSGFEREELYGKAHNVVRHPDMPPAAFEDMWATIRKGLPWSALVKNRRKNGDHYWVRANASPIRRQGVLVGYLSVRTKASEQEVREHAALYERINAGELHIKLSRGFVVRARGVGAWWGRLRFLSLGARLKWAAGGLMLTGATGMALVLSEQASSVAQVGGVAAWLLGGRLAWWLQRDVARPLRDVLEQAQAVASGQQAQPLMLQRGDEIGDLMRSVRQAGLNQTSLVGDIQGKAALVRQCTEELQEGNALLSERTQVAASNLEQAAASLEELTSAIQANSEKAGLAVQRAEAGGEATRRGVGTVQKMRSTMQGIAAASQRVAEISTLIDGIAFQTNLLALNAAVEAARAGEHGKGFAVVAAQVRVLSQKSAQAARDIKELIDRSLAQVRSGTQAATEAGDTMDSVAETVSSLDELVQDIRLASHEQAQGVEQINAAMAQLEQLTQQNAELVRSSADLGASLARQAQHLDAAASAFQPGGAL